MLLENIKKLCASRNISLSALEKTLGFGNSTIAKWANCSPTVEKLSLVADYFGVSVDSLLQKPGEGGTRSAIDNQRYPGNVKAHNPRKRGGAGARLYPAMASLDGEGTA